MERLFVKKRPSLARNVGDAGGAWVRLLVQGPALGPPKADTTYAHRRKPPPQAVSRAP